jgi:HSP20 family protein
MAKATATGEVVADKQDSVTEEHPAEEKSVHKEEENERVQQNKDNMRMSLFRSPFMELSSMRSPFDAMDRLFDDDFFALSSPRSMMDRFDRLERTMFSSPPMPLLRDFDSIRERSNAILRRSSPAYEISEDETQFKLTLDLPGVRPEDCTVEVENDGKLLHIYGGRKIEKDGGYSETRFDQRFTLGKNLDKDNISANLSHGVMVVTAPKLAIEEAPQTRIIDITSNPHSIVSEASTEETS